MKKNLAKSLLADIFFGGKGYQTDEGETTPLPRRAIICTLVLTALVLALVFSFIEISSLTSDIGDLKKEEVSLTSKEGKLQDDFGHKYPEAELLSEIEKRGFTPSGGNTVVLPSESEEDE